MLGFEIVEGYPYGSSVSAGHYARATQQCAKGAEYFQHVVANGCGISLGRLGNRAGRYDWQDRMSGRHVGTASQH